MSIDYKKYPFTSRVRHHTSPNFYFPLSELKTIPNHYPPLIESINWEEKYTNALPPDVLDIGCGKGAFLLEYAMNNPDWNAMGIEIRSGIVRWINNIIEGEEIPNCSALWYSVANGLHFIGDSSILKVFYLFPDPWPKKRHQKRRAFNFMLLDEIKRIIKPGGRLYLATDVHVVDKHHRDTLTKHGAFDFEEVVLDEDWGLPVTNKEKFCRKENIPFYRLICKLK
jgi:tRNA (guanine-N7-)-methyltransferase